MTQIGEMVAPPDIDVDQDSCPFDHTAPEPPTVDNSLIGKGGTLASSLKGAKTTRLYAPMKGTVDPVKNPKDQPGHEFFNKARCVEIRDAEYVHSYPVTCAAHHCIPAQESLKESPLLTFMVKQGASEALKDLSYSDGVVWADVGYDVNGSQNGVFLPGSYAVGGGRGGMGVWDSTDDGDEDDADDAAADVAAAAADPASNQLTGALNEITATNRKWQYVKQAVAKCPGQFHDRHVDYSTFVQSVLEKMFENYNNHANTNVFGAACSKCAERGDKIEKLGIPTPHSMLDRLDVTSRRLAGFLNGTTWRMNIFTSKWGKAYMEEKKKGNPAAG